MEELSTIPTPCTTKIQALRDSIAQIIVGQTQATDLLLTSVIARGHVLIEGVPGVAKTLLARVMAQLIDARFSRVQFTPDLSSPTWCWPTRLTELPPRPRQPSSR